MSSRGTDGRVLALRIFSLILAVAGILLTIGGIVDFVGDNDGVAAWLSVIFGPLMVILGLVRAVRPPAVR